MQYVSLVAVIAICQYIFFGAMTGHTRRKAGLKAPAITGHEGFERMYRVQINTLETLMAFLPALFLASIYWPAFLVAGLGVVYLVGRHIYWRSYIKDPSKRGMGFMLSILPTLLLIVLALAGVLSSLIGSHVAH
jgi:glutathione S-transferase